MITGSYLRKLREKLGLSQYELAKLVGVTQAHIAKIERGKVDPKLSTVNKILKVLKNVENSPRCKEIATRNLIYVTPNDKVAKAVELMLRHDISQLPVMEKGKPVGSLKESTILKNLVCGIGDRKVKEIMEECFPIIDEDESVEVAKMLLKVHQAVLVSKRGKITGIITKSDLLKLVT